MDPISINDHNCENCVHKVGDPGNPCWWCRLGDGQEDRWEESYDSLLSRTRAYIQNLNAEISYARDGQSDLSEKVMELEQQLKDAEERIEVRDGTIVKLNELLRDIRDALYEASAVNDSPLKQIEYLRDERDRAARVAQDARNSNEAVHRELDGLGAPRQQESGFGFSPVGRLRALKALGKETT